MLASLDISFKPLGLIKAGETDHMMNERKGFIGFFEGTIGVRSTPGVNLDSEIQGECSVSLFLKDLFLHQKPQTDIKIMSLVLIFSLRPD